MIFSQLSDPTIYFLVIITLCVLLLVQTFWYRRTIIQLIDRVMAKNYGEIIQGQVLIKGKPENLEVKIPTDEGPDPVAELNKLI